MSYFLLRLFTFLCCCMNKFFIRTTNNFLVVLQWIIFNTSIENYFLMVLIIIFRCIANLFLGLQFFAGLAVKVDWFESLTSLGDHFENFASWGVHSKRMPRAKNWQGKKQKGFSSFLQNLSGASGLCIRDQVFWTEDLIEETTKRLHDSYTILTPNPYWTWHVCPIENLITNDRLQAPDRFCKKDENLFHFFPWHWFALSFSLKALLHLQSFQNGRPRKSKTQTSPLQMQGPQCFVDQKINLGYHEK